MSPRARRWLAAVTAAAALAVTGTGCSTTMRDLPIPGTGVSGDKIELSADFHDALNLAEGAPVKVNGVDSGKVTGITVDHYTAHVTMDVRTDAQIREGATVRLRYTTPLGELFIDVSNPTSGPVMKDGETLGLPSTQTAPTVEDALAEASLLVNGGGLDQLRIITDELNKALGGNEENIRGLLDRADRFLTEANATTQSIDAVLSSLNGLSRTLNDRKSTINKAMRQIRPAAAVLRRATPGFTALLKAVQRFSGAANNTVNATRTQLLNLLAEVEPTLRELASNSGRFDSMLRSIQQAASSARQIIPTEYGNVAGSPLHLDGIEGTGVTGGLLDLLDVIGMVLPSDQVNQILQGLGLGGPAAKSAGDGSTAPGPSGGIDDLLGLDSLLGGLTGGGS